MNKRTNKLKIFEIYVLRALSLQFFLIGVMYLFYKQWWTGIIVILASFLFGMIGQGLKHNKHRSAMNLTRGQDWNIIEDGDEPGLTPEEGRLIGVRIFFTCWIVFFTFSGLLIHHDFKWYTSFPLGFVIGITYPLLLFVFGIYVNKSKIKK